MLAIESIETNRGIQCFKEWIQKGNLIQANSIEDAKNQFIKISGNKILFKGAVSAPRIEIQTKLENVEIDVDGSLNADSIKLETNNAKVCLLQSTNILCTSFNVASSHSLINYGIISGNDDLKFILNIDKFFNGNTGDIKADNLIMKITGDLINYGKITSKNKIEMNLQNLISPTFLVHKEMENHFGKSMKQIIAKVITLFAEKSIEDCSPLNAGTINLSANEDIICEANTSWNCGKIKMKCNNFIIHGSAELGDAKIVSKTVSTSSYGNVNIGLASIQTTDFELFGTWQCQNFVLKSITDESIVTFLNENKNDEIPESLKKIDNQNCKIDEDGKLIAFDATIFSRNLSNNGKIEVNNKLTIYAQNFQQENDASVEGRNKLNIMAHSFPKLNGFIKSDDLEIKVFEKFSSLAMAEVEEVNVYLYNFQTSKFVLKNEMLINPDIQQNNAIFMGKTLEDEFELTAETLKTMHLFNLRDMFQLM
uniref:Uncharacterized protein n=1 Tax=Panagrolaimus superbus TaxID=310955 RepID=A0A914XU56_9BILA